MSQDVKARPAPDQIGILLVEDEELVRADIVATLQAAGMCTYEVSTATDALALLEQHATIRVLITDVALGRGAATGFHLAKVVAERHPRVGILILSGGPLPAVGERPPRARFLSKPCEPRSLVSAVFSVVEQHQHD